MKDLIRKEAIEHFSSHINMYRSVRAAQVRTAVFLAIILICSVCFAYWAVFGTIYETLSTDGMIWPPQNEITVYAEGDGLITNVSAGIGDRVEAGDVLAVIPQNDMLQQIENGINSGAPEEEIRNMRSAYEELSVIRSNVGGIILQTSAPYTIVSRGDPVAVILPQSDVSNTMYAFLPYSQRDLIHAGMEVHVVPVSALIEQYGYIYGYISDISYFPVSGAYIKENEENFFFSDMEEDDQYVQLEITFIPDSDTQNRLKWSNPAGGSARVDTGTTCRADIILKETHPLNWLLH